MIDFKSISLEGAKKYCLNAINLADEKGYLISVTIVDIRGMILCTMTLDDALILSSSLSSKKAVTALHLKMNTIELERAKINVADLGENYCCFGGGVTIVKDNKVVGAIGISGLDHSIDDHRLATEAINIE